ncbi:MAG: DUF5666 domain-containing protein [Gammaproteobacteria bacterium]|nr:DUF5666 domain-containing protein [Gammaproteobacteria bacterium]MDH4313757.1 DUF5666 domain-containing protein [Gammaproteobacteria bacterium]MDH5213477.1 DUF5666 domain-containing protein [Gammaproteobacteria bacterium]
MNAKLQQLHYLGLAFLGLLGACSGSVSVSPTVNIPPIPDPPPPAATEDISTLGVISGLNSVTVNGVRYETPSTTVTVNGQLANLSDLELGQIVSLEGTIEVDGPRGTANRIDYEATVIGPVESIDAALGRLVVMGQIVRTDADTIFDAGIDPATFAGLAVGANAQISGFLDSSGEFNATRVEPDTTSTEVQVIGSVIGLDLANMVFGINRLTVDYGSAAVIDLPSGMPTDGMFVIVKGSLVNGILVVDEILSLYDWDDNPGDRVQVSGVITRFASPDDFDINGFPALADANTRFSNGTISDLAANAYITIDGEFATGGDRVLSNEISFGSIVGPTTTSTFNFENFTDISIFSVFHVEVSQSPDYLVETTIDNDDVNRLDVSQTGSNIRIGVGPEPGNDRIETIEAVVTLPVLDSIDLDGVINVKLNDFSQTQLTATVGGVSRLHSNSLMINDLTANVAGVSQLDFGDIRPLGNADINLSGVSTATLNMDIGSTISGSVSGTSRLYYYGTNVTVNVTTGALSSVERLGATRP